MQPVWEEAAWSGADPAGVLADSASDPDGPEQWYADGGKDPVHHCQYDPAVEESNGVGSGRGAFGPGSGGSAGSDGYDQRTPEKECGQA